MPPDFSKDTGAVLVITLLFLLVITLLSLNVLQNSLLDSKMNSSFSSQDIDLAEAELRLMQEEEKLDNQEPSQKAVEISGSDQKDAPYVCGVSFYRVSVQTKKGTIVQSTYAVENKKDQCATKTVVKIRRQSWFTDKVKGE